MAVNLPIPGAVQRSFILSRYFFVTAQENDLPHDPGNLPGKVLVKINQEVKRFLEIIGSKT
jgi:hypothetical protein